MAMSRAGLVGGRKINIMLGFEFRMQASNERLEERFDNRAITYWITCCVYRTDYYYERGGAVGWGPTLLHGNLWVPSCRASGRHPTEEETDTQLTTGEKTDAQPTEEQMYPTTRWSGHKRELVYPTALPLVWEVRIPTTCVN